MVIMRNQMESHMETESEIATGGVWGYVGYVEYSISAFGLED